MKHVLLGVTGCIAAYKACEILRGLQKAGCDVRVVMTDAAREFVGETTFAALSGHSVGVAEFGDRQNPIPHIEFAQWADVFLIAPATANVVAKLRAGIADDLLTSCALACTAPVCVAPAMNVHMYENAATQENLACLRARGVHVLDPAYGHLACGYDGAGKLPPVEDVVAFMLDVLNAEGVTSKAPADSACLSGARVLITSGPTVEPIDAVRFISNFSSGKMGAALAQAALEAGAQVSVVSGPVSVQYPQGARVLPVQTAEEMLDAAALEAKCADIIVCAAAVCDMRPQVTHQKKLKKCNAQDAACLAEIKLTENPDILATLSAAARPGQVVCGFAAETENVEQNARQKLASKGAHFIVGNPVGQGVGFGADANSAVIVSAADVRQLPQMPKAALAREIIDFAAAEFERARA